MLLGQVATWEDPATARLGESIYMFVPRSVLGNLRDGWMAETRRLQSRRLRFLSLNNRCAAFCSSAPVTTFRVHALWLEMSSICLICADHYPS